MADALLEHLVCVCVCSVYVSMCVCGHICAHVYGSQSGFLAKPNIPWVDWLASQLWRSMCLQSQNWGYRHARPHLAF